MMRGIRFQKPELFVSLAYDRIETLNPRPQSLLDLQNVLEGFPGQAYVDAYHYSPATHDLLARKVISALQIASPSRSTK